MDTSTRPRAGRRPGGHGPSNPWLLNRGQKPYEVPEEAPADVGARVPGPTQPQPSVVPPDAVDRLPRRATAHLPRLWWVGAHGGAGESTLAALLAGTAAAGRAWPGRTDDVDADAPVVLVARTHLAGLLAAQRALVDWAAGQVPGVQLLGLVLVADAPGRLPRALRDLTRLVAGGAPRTWQLPWVDEWRTTRPRIDQAPASAGRVLSDLTRLLSTQTSAPEEGTT